MAGACDLSLLHQLRGLGLELFGALQEAVEAALVLIGLVGLLLELILGAALFVPLAGTANVGLARTLGFRLQLSLLPALVGALQA